MKNDSLIASYPHLADYHVPITFLLTHITKVKIMPPLPITKRTIELGEKYSPDFVCLPFKYNLGNFIESLENGANVLIQAGGGCRYGYYAEVQEQILRDLGYNFQFITLVNSDKFTISYLYNTFKSLNPKLSFIKCIYYLLLAIKMIDYMDKIDIYIRANIGFEHEPHSFDKLKVEMLEVFSQAKSFIDLRKKYRYYTKRFHSLPVDKPVDCLKVGVIGELFTSMEPNASYFLEQELAKMKIEVARFTNVTYLLIGKRLQAKKLLKSVKKYTTYQIGADGMDNVARSKMLALKKYDGIIHIKPFGCTPEIGAMYILKNISDDYKIPIMYLTFDTQTSETGLKTRLEAFYDMIAIRKEKLDKHD